jgi:hypothetical protein
LRVLVYNNVRVRVRDNFIRTKIQDIKKSLEPSKFRTQAQYPSISFQHAILQTLPPRLPVCCRNNRSACLETRHAYELHEQGVGQYEQRISIES